MPVTNDCDLKIRIFYHLVIQRKQNDSNRLEFLYFPPYFDGTFVYISLCK